MSLVGFKAKNHKQQVAKSGARDDTDDRGTRPEVFDPLNAEFGFTLDVAAAVHNRKCERFYSSADNGLSKPWNGVAWCNPPYSDLRAWTLKAIEEVSGECPLAVLLFPANRCEQKWWQELIEPNRDGRGTAVSIESRFLPGRPRFDRPGWTKPVKGDRPPFGLVVLIVRKASDDQA